MKLDLKNRDSLGTLIVYVKMHSETFYCMAEVEYWLGEYWNGYVDLNKGSLETQYFNFIKRFRLDYQALYSAYEQLDLSDIFEREANKPSIYIDFEERYFASYFQESELEERLAEGWRGEYRNIVNLIPLKYRYWELKGVVSQK
ncbi:MAG: hypothetical protein N4A49_14945 [Marinifilaceae bacterium]|jgi:hypothetical protein|nr:hypothetical protein [Marinifilaceae bacterium]